MTKKLFLLLVPMLFICNTYAQKSLFFINKKTNKVIEVREGNFLHAQYTGYLGQTEFAKNVVTEITDSFIVLGTNPEELPGFSKGLVQSSARKSGNAYKVIRVADLTGFRRMSAGRVVAKAALSTAAVVGAYFLLTELYQSNNVGTGSAFLISLGTGVASTFLINAIFPENIRYQLKDDWEVKVAHPTE